MVCRVFGNVGNLPTMFPTCRESDGLWEHWTGSQTTRNQLATLLTLGTQWFNLLGGWWQRARDTSHWMNRLAESISFTESWLNVKYELLLLCMRPEKAAIFWGWRPHSLTHSFSSMFDMRNRARHFISWFHLLTCLERIAASHYLARGRMQWLSMPCLILSIRLSDISCLQSV